MVPQWGFFASYIFSEPHAARLRPASSIRTKATSCGSMADIQSATAEIRRGKKKKKEERKKETTGQKYNVRICYAGRP